MKRLSALITLMLSPLFALAVQIEDPEKDFIYSLIKSEGGYEGLAEVKKINIDFNLDGIDDYFFTIPEWSMGRGGDMWLVYLSDGNYYNVDWENRPVFRDDSLYYGHVENIGRQGLLTYFPGSSRDGSLMVIFLDDENVVNVKKIKTISPKESSEDRKLYEDLFSKNNIPLVERLSVDTSPFKSEGPVSKYTGGLNKDDIQIISGSAKTNDDLANK